MDTIITLEQLIKLDKRLADAQIEVKDLGITMTQMLGIYTGLAVGMRLIVTKEARKHLGGAPNVRVGHGATIDCIWVDCQGAIAVTVNYGKTGTNVQSLERVQAMRAEWLKQ